MKIETKGKYDTQLHNLLAKDPQLDPVIRLAVKRFSQNPQDTRLHTHALRKRLTSKHAFSVTNDIRIVFEYIGNNTVRFLAIGDHTQVYPRFQKPE